MENMNAEIVKEAVEEGVKVVSRNGGSKVWKYVGAGSAIVVTIGAIAYGAYKIVTNVKNKKKNDTSDMDTNYDEGEIVDVEESELN